MNCAADDPNYGAVQQIRISARRLESLAAEIMTVSLLERDEYRPQLECGGNRCLASRRPFLLRRR